jgi:hypothetical protein
MLLLFKELWTWHESCNKSLSLTQQVAWATLANEGITMRTRKIENGLALLGALIVLLGVTFAASSALADEAINLNPTLNIEAPTTN